MNRKFTSMVFAFFSLASLSTLDSARAQSRFAMSVDLAPGYGWVGPNPYVVDDVVSNNSSIKTGTSIHFRLSPNWSLSSGLWLEWIHSGKSSVDVKGVGHRLNIPLLVHYQVGTKRLSPYLSAGSAVDRFMYSVVTYNRGTTVTSVFDYRLKLNLRYMMGAGVRYKINDQLSGVVQPMFAYDPRYEGKRYELALQTQLLFHF